MRRLLSADVTRKFNPTLVPGDDALAAVYAIVICAYWDHAPLC